MSRHSEPSEADRSRVAKPPGGTLAGLLWLGPMLMLLGAAVGSGELVAEPVAGAKYGPTLLWAILAIVLTKAIWNEAIGRVAIATGQNFLESCSGAGPLLAWVPWVWYVVNAMKDFLLRGGIVAIAGLICYDVFGSFTLIADYLPEKHHHVVAWTVVNYVLIWVLLAVGGYGTAERVNAVLCVLFTLCLMVCAAVVLPGAMDTLASGLKPEIPTNGEELLMLVTLTGIVMAGSTTVYYSAWAEQLGMGLFGPIKRTGRRITVDEMQPESDEEIRRVHGWLRVNRMNVALTYLLGAAVCLSTFILGVVVLRPEGVTLEGPELAPELSLMMTKVAGPWAKSVFYIGACAAVLSTAIGVLDGGSRMYVQPIRRATPALFARLSFASWQKLIMTGMVVGCLWIYILVPKPVTLILWMGAIDAPLVGMLMIAYAYLGRWYLPPAYRYGVAWSLVMLVIGVLYLALGGYFFFVQVTAVT